MVRSSLTALFALPLVACGGDDGGGVQLVDAPAGPAVDAAAPDAPPADAAVVCPLPAFGDLGALTGTAVIDGYMLPEPTDDLLRFDAPVGDPAMPDTLSIQLYGGYGVFPGAVTTGTYTLAGGELAFDTCGACLILAANDGSSYMPTGGTVTVTSVGVAAGDTLSGSLANVTFQHVTIESMSGVTTPVGDGCTASIAAATFTGALTLP